ncbi:MAG: hypothetical protein DWB56_06900 [Candidatus Jettenia sp.]|nr:MAG: hypothetical protein EDM77_03840 [Candidatus Jettenia sp. AMX1]MBC6928682.1 hypothetical protein [Candidatus Jettenia sp.]MCE7879994.1 hypothetical protein [Candidatus Jettenia sp. AMX1]MCQ3926776.1 hypothetical protein [Candidatus Jettenia sp.]
MSKKGEGLDKVRLRKGGVIMPVDISRVLKKYIPIFQEAHEQGINEAETSMRIGKFLEDALGYDVFSEISKEHTVKDKYVDYAIKLNNKVAFFIEIKQAGMELRKSYIEQASNYAANAGVEWIILTSGRYWQAYHLNFNDGIQNDLVWSVDILENDIYDTAYFIGLLHKKSILKGELEDYYLRIKTLSPKSIIRAIFQEDTLRIIRKHLRVATGINVDEEEVTDSIKEMLSKEAWEEIGDVKIKRKKKISKSKQNTKETPTLIEESTTTQKPEIIENIETPSIVIEKEENI